MSHILWYSLGRNGKKERSVVVVIIDLLNRPRCSTEIWRPGGDYSIIFLSPVTMKQYGSHCLTMESPSDCIDTIMDRLSDVRYISITSGRFSSSVTSRSLYDDHSTAKRAFLFQKIRLSGTKERLKSICVHPGTVFPCVTPFILTIKTGELGELSWITGRIRGVLRLLHKK